jgi:hypothetical protein
MKLKKLISMRDALSSPAYFGGLLSGDSWAAWRVLLIAIVGEPLTKAERVVFESLTDRPREPQKPVEEFWGVHRPQRRQGRPSGLSRGLCGSPQGAGTRRARAVASHGGEHGSGSASVSVRRGDVPRIAALAGLVENVTSDTISLANKIDITICAASWRTVRGVTAVGAICDEIATWWSSEESANPDKEILRALRPTLSTPNGILIAISSPYAKRGELYKVFRKHYDPDGHPAILVAKAPTRIMNPTVEQERIDRAYEEDPEAAAAEWGVEFRGDLEVFVSREAIDGAVARGVTVRPPIDGVFYFCFLDPASGSGRDSMTAAICHREPGGRIVLDCLLERKPPFSPAQTAAEFAETMRRYRITRATSGRWGVGFVDAVFQQCGIEITTSEKVKSDLYLSFLPILNSGQVDLLDHPKMISQFCQLERRTSRSGKGSVDHPRDAHDDLCNAAAGAIVCIGSAKPDMKISDALVDRLHRHAAEKRFHEFRFGHGSWREHCRRQRMTAAQQLDWRTARL